MDHSTETNTDEIRPLTDEEKEEIRAEIRRQIDAWVAERRPRSHDRALILVLVKVGMVGFILGFSVALALSTLMRSL